MEETIIERIDAVFLPVKNLEESLEWYTETFAFPVLWKNMRMAGLSIAPNCGFHIVEVKDYEAKYGYTPFNFVVKDLQELREKLIGMKVEVSAIKTDDPVRFDFIDINGNAISVIQLQPSMELTNKKIMDSKNGIELQDLRDHQLHMASFKGSDLFGVDMRNTKLTHTNFVDSKWEHIFFSNVKINLIQMGGTVFENIIRPKAEKSELNEEPGTDGWLNVEPVEFKNSDLSTAIFDSCNLSHVELVNCNIEGLTINGVSIKELLERE